MNATERHDEELIDLRCPLGSKALLARVVLENGGRPIQASREYGVVQLSCRDCAKQLRKGDPSVRRVLHEFNVLGQLVESRVQRDRDLRSS